MPCNCEKKYDSMMGLGLVTGATQQYDGGATTASAPTSAAPAFESYNQQAPVFYNSQSGDGMSPWWFIGGAAIVVFFIIK